MMVRRPALTAIWALAWILAAAADQDERPLRVYFIGNSVADTLKYRPLGESSQ